MPRQCNATGVGSSFPTEISNFSPRFELLIETSERPGRRFHSVRAQGEADGGGS